MMRLEGDESGSVADEMEYQQKTKTWCKVPRGTCIICFLSVIISAAVMIASVFVLSTDLPPFHEAFKQEEIMAHLKVLNDIANNHTGSRSITKGFNASRDHFLDVLAKHPNYFEVTVQEFPIRLFTETAPPFMGFYDIKGDLIHFDSNSFQTLKYSGSGTINDTMNHIPNDGCSIEDFESADDRKIALIRRGGCRFEQKAKLAQEAGYEACLIYNNHQGSFSGTLGALNELEIPVLAISDELGEILMQFSEETVIKIDVHSKIEEAVTSNIIAATKDGDEENTIICGAHLDSVDTSPGINDNGSGSAAILVIANLLAHKKTKLKNKIIFAWWGAEEEGLIGSRYFADSLEKSDKLKNIALNLNVDMIGSPNFMRGVYNASTSSSSDEKVVSASHHIQEYFEKFFKEHELHYELVDFNGRSDYESFIEKGIPAGGLFTGGELNKDDAGRAKYGGLTDAPHDPCYHKPCDTLDNVDPGVLLEMSRALAFVLYDLADNGDLRKFLEEGFPETKP